MTELEEQMARTAATLNAALDRAEAEIAAAAQAVARLTEPIPDDYEGFA